MSAVSHYTISPLFGEIAMNLGLVQPRDVLDALCLQEETQSRGLPARRIGQILIERGLLKKEDVTRIMEEIEQRTRTLEIPGFTSLGLISRNDTTLEFRGLTIGTRRAVHIRFLRFGLAENTEDSKRFARESRMLSRLGHPSVVKVLAVGDLEGIPYLVQENVSATSLKKRIEDFGTVPEARAAKVFADVAAGLEHAHMLEILHGAIRPDAILLPKFGPAKVTDFALFDWASFAAARGAARLETPHYTSPEQAKKSSRPTVRSDVYSLGATLFHALTGQPPFLGSYVEVVNQHLKSAPPDPRSLNRDLSPEVASLVCAMLEKAPEDRPSDMGEIVRSLGGLLTPEPEPPAPDEPARLRSRRRDT